MIALEVIEAMEAAGCSAAQIVAALRADRDRLIRRRCELAVAKAILGDVTPNSVTVVTSQASQPVTLVTPVTLGVTRRDPNSPGAIRQRRYRERQRLAAGQSSNEAELRALQSAGMMIDAPVAAEALVTSHVTNSVTPLPAAAGRNPPKGGSTSSRRLRGSKPPTGGKGAARQAGQLEMPVHAVVAGRDTQRLELPAVGVCQSATQLSEAGEGQSAKSLRFGRRVQPPEPVPEPTPEQRKRVKDLVDGYLRHVAEHSTGPPKAETG